MDSVETLKSAWIFDKKGGIKETKKKQDKQKAKEIFNIAKEALRYAPTLLHEGEKLKRISCTPYFIRSYEWPGRMADNSDSIGRDHRDDEGLEDMIFINVVKSKEYHRWQVFLGCFHPGTLYFKLFILIQVIFVRALDIFYSELVCIIDFGLFLLPVSFSLLALFFVFFLSVIFDSKQEDEHYSSWI